jgi:hypothetical protein
MKKAIISPLCSALVIPGLGQVINQHFKKGGFILCVVFILFITAMVKLYQIVKTIFKDIEIHQLDFTLITDRLRAEDISTLWYLVMAFAILWLYSVLDAFWAGKKIDRLEEGA